MSQPSGDPSKPLRTVWIECDPHSVVTVGLKQTLEEWAQVWVGRRGSGGEPSSIILCSEDAEGVSERVRHLKEENPDVAILVFGSWLDLPLARAALRAGPAATSTPA